ncbi:MAG: hypothetical protein JW938_01595 [Candidatus Omnitrophica bacterium]|nr:hypothetical protein [Candidatus Omnitrophota bacterium]
MAKKPKFKPEITRVKLNPEQAVLACTCMAIGMQWTHRSWIAHSSYIDRAMCTWGRDSTNHKPCYTNPLTGYYGFAHTSGTASS